MANYLRWIGVVGAALLVVVDFFTSVSGYQQIMDVKNVNWFSEFIPYAFASVCLGFNAMAPHFTRQMFDEGFGSLSAIVISACFVLCYVFDCFSSLVTLLDTYVGIPNYELWTIYQAIKSLSFMAAVLFFLTALLLAASPFILQRFLEIGKPTNA